MIYLFSWSNKDFSWRVNKYLLVFWTLSVASSITWPRQEIIVHWHIISGSCTTSFWEQVMVLFRIIRQDLEEKKCRREDKKDKNCVLSYTTTAACICSVDTAKIWMRNKEMTKAWKYKENQITKSFLFSWVNFSKYIKTITRMCIISASCFYGGQGKWCLKKNEKKLLKITWNI